jgi:hypothetical protein
MTRETKIGLLVGLAFIIVIGILLSDHLTTSTEPPQATLASAGNNVRSAVVTPGAATNPPITNVITPAAIAPQQAVPTPQDVAKAQPVQPVQVAVGGPISTAARTINTPATLSAPQPVQPTSPVATDSNQQSTDNTTAAPVDNKIDSTPAQTQAAAGNDVASALRTAAQQKGEELIPVGRNGTSTTSGNAQQITGKKLYPAVEGDTLYKICARQMGANNKANRDAFIAANPSLKDDPNKIIAGHSYVIPTATGTTATSSVATASNPAAPTNTTAPKATSNTLPAATAGDNWYTIKSGDTLTTIAEDQCGTSQAVAAIVELNKDTLKDPNRIIINTKIRLPNKPVASAN